MESTPERVECLTGIVMAANCSFREYCESLNLCAREVALVEEFRTNTFGHNKIQLNDFLLTACGFTGNFEIKKVQAICYMRKHSVPMVPFFGVPSNCQMVAFTFENCIRLMNLRVKLDNMTKISRLQIIKFMKICLGYHDRCYYNLTYNPLSVCRKFYNANQHLVSPILMLPTATMKFRAADPKPAGTKSICSTRIDPHQLTDAAAPQTLANPSVFMFL